MKTASRKTAKNSTVNTGCQHILRFSFGLSVKTEADVSTAASVSRRARQRGFFGDTVTADSKITKNMVI